MRRAYSYHRMSDPRQADGDSLRRQSEAAAEYCKHNNSALTELALHKGSALKGLNQTKGSLAKFLAGIEAGIVKPGDVLIVESLDRLSRQEPLDALDLFSKIVRSGVEIHTLQPSDIYERKTINQSGKLHVVLAFMQRAHEESSTKAYRVKQAFDARLKDRRAGSKKQIHGKPPGWIDIVDGKSILNRHADTVRQIVQWGIDGLGPVAICKRLNQERIPLMTRKGCKRWEFSAVANIFSTRRAIGEYQPTERRDGKRVDFGEPIKGYYPAVVTEKTFYKLQAVLASRKLNVKGRQTKKIANLFGRLLVCDDDVEQGVDAGTMVLSTKRTGKTNMVSINAVRGLTEYNSFDYKAFESAFLKWVCEVRLDDNQPAYDDLAADKGRRAELDSNIATLQKKLTTGGKGKFAAGLELLESMEAERNSIRERINEKEMARAAPPPSTKEIAKLLTEAKDTDDEQLLRSKLRIAIANCVGRIGVRIRGTNLLRVCSAKVSLADGYERFFNVYFERGKEPRSHGCKKSKADELLSQFGKPTVFPLFEKPDTQQTKRKPRPQPRTSH